MGAEEQREGMGPTGAIERLVTKNLDKIAVLSRALLVLAAIVAIAALGLVVVVEDQTGRLVGLSVFLALMLVITALLYLTSRASTGGRENADHATVGAALSLVNGCWWQLVVNDRSPGLSLIHIDLSVLPNRHHLSGTKYAPDGKEVAIWKSRAVGLIGIEPVEVFYYWQGSYARAPGTVSGVGVFDFPAASGADVRAGTGWFTTGDVERGDFSVSSKVHLRRADPEDESIVDRGGADREALVQRRYRTWMEDLAGDQTVSSA